MHALSVLEQNKRTTVAQMVRDLSQIQGIEVIVLGGSYARGTARSDSDVDLGFYYSEIAPPSIQAIQDLAKKYSTLPDCVVTQFYEWGPWVNGGAWIHTRSGKVDLLYRNLDQVNRVLADAEQGRFSWDFRQQPPYGFFSVTYLADLQNNLILHDPKGLLAKLQSSLATYPEALRQALIQEHLWSVEFTLLNAKKSAARGCVYTTTGCMTRIAAELTQVLFALNRVYFATDKGALEAIDAFLIQSENYASKMNALLNRPGHIDSIKELEELVQEVIALAHPLYQPKYTSML